MRDIEPIQAQILKQHDHLKSWLFEHALPLWGSAVDTKHGGLIERINLDGAYDDIDRRSRVPGRQLYAFGQAKIMGYGGDITPLIEACLSWLKGPARRPDGYFYTVLSPKAEIVNPDLVLYDHAFAILGYAHVFDLAAPYNALKNEAAALRDRMIKDYSHPLMGFEESRPPSLPLKANPHMHMFEACQAWVIKGGDDRWRQLADEIARLCVQRFINPDTGALHEFFAADWTPMPGDLGRILEPGHLYEWAWLLLRWAQIDQQPHYIAPAIRLIEVADENGLDRVRNVAFNELWSDYQPKDFKARTWHQTERIKAYVLLSKICPPAQKTQVLERLLAAIHAFANYLDTPTRGLWYDCMDENGRFIYESAPASTLYHIVCAIDELGKTI